MKPISLKKLYQSALDFLNDENEQKKYPIDGIMKSEMINDYLRFFNNKRWEENHPKATKCTCKYLFGNKLGNCPFCWENQKKQDE